ncbi:MAG: 2-oxoacid:acceptor oxidoreductase family protein, partial [Actinomycetes bacterium]
MGWPEEERPLPGRAHVQVEVLLTGIGGQGVQLAAKALAAAANDEGRDVMLSAHFGGEMRGGLTEASVAVADERLTCVPILPSAWSAYVMHAEFWPVVAERLRPGGVVVANSSVVGDGLSDAEGPRVFMVPAGALASA